MASSLTTQALLSAAEKGLNTLLDSDPTVLTELALIKEQVIAIHIDNPTITLYIIPTEQGVVLSTQTELPLQVELTTSTSYALQLLIAQYKQPLLHSPNLTITGNAEVAFKFFEIIDRLAPYWEHKLFSWANSLPDTIKQLLNLSPIQLHSFTAPIVSWFNQSLNDLPTPHTVLNTLQKKFRV